MLWGGLLGLAALLVVVVFFSITVGARPIALETVWTALTRFDAEATEHRIILELRLPRTLVGLLVGAALGLAGAILQGATRNPLADPGILGIHAGAALFVVVGIAGFGLATLSSYVWLAFAAEVIAEVFGKRSQIVRDPVSGTPMVVPVGRHHK